MRDERLRQLERAALAGEPGAQEALELLRARLGEGRRYWLSGRSSQGPELHMTLVMLIRGELVPTSACPAEATSWSWIPSSDPVQLCGSCLKSLVPNEETLTGGSRVWQWQLALAALGGAPAYPLQAGCQDEVAPALAEVLSELEFEPDLAERLRAKL